eukprot:scaffold56715_cov19-Tisochrysis_lutea.AAC.3
MDMKTYILPLGSLQAVRYLGPGAMMGQVTTLALHIPQCDLNAMKTKCSGWLMAYGHGWAWEKASSESGAKSQGMRSPQPLRLSSHDVIAAMLRLLINRTRGHPQFLTVSFPASTVLCVCLTVAPGYPHPRPPSSWPAVGHQQQSMRRRLGNVQAPARGSEEQGLWDHLRYATELQQSWPGGDRLKQPKPVPGQCQLRAPDQ